MKTLILSLVTLIFMSGFAHATIRTTDEQYIRLDLAPLCTEEGQVSVTFTNTSGEKLFVDPHVADPTVFDATRAMFLQKNDGFSRVGLTPLTEYVRLSNWSVLKAGESVKYPIDFTKYAKIDTTITYRAGADLRIKTLLEDGQQVVILVNSGLLNKFVDIEPDCFK